MLIHLIASMRHFNDDVTILEKISDVLDAKNISLARNWYAAVKSRKDRQSILEQDLNWTEIVEDNIKAATQSDALIIEGSRYNYSQAFQTAIALQNNKPVLNLYRTNLPEYRDWPDKFFVSGIDNPLFHNVPYETPEDIPKIVEDFIENITPKIIDLTVTFSLDAQSMDYIKKTAYESDSTIDTAIKDIVQQKADNSD